MFLDITAGLFISLEKTASLLSVFIWPFIYHQPLISWQNALAVSDGLIVVCAVRNSLQAKLLEKFVPVTIPG